MKLQKAYKILQDNSGIEIRDTVKVLRKAGSQELGWQLGWDTEMDIQ